MRTCTQNSVLSTQYFMTVHVNSIENIYDDTRIFSTELNAKIQKHKKNIYNVLIYMYRCRATDVRNKYFHI